LKMAECLMSVLDDVVGRSVGCYDIDFKSSITTMNTFNSISRWLSYLGVLPKKESVLRGARNVRVVG